MRKYYILKVYLLFIFLLSFQSKLEAQYCLPSYTYWCNSSSPVSTDYIDNFSTTGGATNITNNGSGCNGTSPNNYIYNSSMTVSQVQGLSFNFSVQAGPTFSQGFRIWIDFNSDQDFADLGEDVYVSPGAALTPYTGTINIPMATSPGVKRMRVLCNYASPPAVNGYCATTYTFGECEDYNLTVIAAIACNSPLAPPLTGGTAVASASNPCPGTNLTVSLTGASLTGGLAYQWLQGSNCLGPWVAISGLVNPSALTSTLSVVTVPGSVLGYRCRVTCTFSGLSDTSTMACVQTQTWSCTSPCYGISTATTSANQDIFNVSMGSLNNTTDCVAPLSGSQGAGVGSGSMYANFTGVGGVPSVTIYKGLTQSFSLLLGTCGGFNSSTAAKIYIDYNHNASFLDPGEEVYSNTAIATTFPSSLIAGSFLVPAVPPPAMLTGCTRMRVIMNTTGGIIPVGSYGTGETEDYSVNIIEPSPYDPAVTNINVPVGTCFTNSETVTVTLCNYGSDTIDLSANMVTASLNVNGPTGVTTYTANVTSGILLPYGVTCVPVTFNAVDLYPGGTYFINSSLTLTGLINGNTVNDSIPVAITRSNYRPTPGPDYPVCQGSIIPFGQGLTVSGCATPVLDSAIIVFTIAPGQPPMCPNTSTSYLGSCLFASAVLPVLPPSPTFIGNGVLTITNLYTLPTCPGCTYASEERFSLFKGSVVPVPAANFFIPGGVGHPGFSVPLGFTYLNNGLTTTTGLGVNAITPLVLGNIYSPSGVGPGGTLNIGRWDIYSTPSTVNMNVGGNPTVATLKFYYTYVPASFEWFAAPTGGPVLYTYSPFNPVGVAGSGISNTNTPGITPFYAACAGSSDCRVPVNLIINSVPSVVQDTLISCEFAVGSNSAVFDLNSINSPVSAFMYPNVDVDYFGDPSLFVPITDPGNDTSSTNFIYSMVSDTVTGCHSSDSVYLIVNSIPQFVSNPIVGNACAPNCVDVASLINPLTTTAGADTLYYADAACTIIHPNPHCISAVDTVYVVLVTNSVPYCSDTTTAIIDIISASNHIVNQDTMFNYSYCNPIGCGFVTIGDGATESLYTITDCRKVATVTDLPNGISLGSTEICEDIDCSTQTHNGQPYVNRHYEITPSVNDSAEVCLYYLAQDFADYDAYASLTSWPTMNPSSNLCITQVDNGSLGSPGSTAIQIPNSAITASYDAATTVWKVCFKVDSFSSFYCHTCNPFNTPLPVNLLSFTGKRVDGVSALKWITGSEQNNSHFTVERSKDSKTFTSISSVIKTKAPHGNSSSPLEYAFTDLTPLNGHNYYRLQQTDIDGHNTRSQIVDIYFGDETMVTLYPNPVNSVLQIEINTPIATNVITKIMDATGRVVRVVEMPLQAGSNNHQIDMREMADGIYMISVSNQKGLNYTQTIQKR